MLKSLKVLKDEVKNLSLEDKVKWLDQQAGDERKGVQTLIKSIEKAIQKEKDELERLASLTQYESQLRKEGYDLIAGIDEVGRGPLAGPVVACAVILRAHDTFLGINDSKKVSLKNRLRLFEEIDEKALAVAFGQASPQEIDDLNILEATKLAMKRAVEALDVQPDFLMIDAVSLDLNIPQMGIIKGDEKSMTIAAASIMAKVTRDHMMETWDETYPGYDFSSNKGYGTAKHYEGLNRQGICPIHRKTFVKEFI